MTFIYSVADAVDPATDLTVDDVACEEKAPLFAFTAP